MSPARQISEKEREKLLDAHLRVLALYVAEDEPRKPIRPEPSKVVELRLA